MRKMQKKECFPRKDVPGTFIAITVITAMAMWAGVLAGKATRKAQEKNQREGKHVPPHVHADGGAAADRESTKGKENMYLMEYTKPF